MQNQDHRNNETAIPVHFEIFGQAFTLYWVTDLTATLDYPYTIPLFDSYVPWSATVDPSDRCRVVLIPDEYTHFQVGRYRAGLHRTDAVLTTDKDFWYAEVIKRLAFRLRHRAEGEDSL